MLTYIKAILIAIYAVFIAVITTLVSPFDSRGRVTHHLSKYFSKGILLIAGVRLSVKGEEHLDKNKSYIFVSNHQSFFDIPVLMQAVPNNLRFIYKSSLSKIPIFGWGMYLGGYIPINRTNAREAIKTLRKAAERIVKGISVAIFPEGTRSPDGTLGRFKRGAFLLAEEAKVDLAPVTIIGTNLILPKTKFKISSGKVEVYFDKPVPYTGEKTLLEDIRAIIAKRKEQLEK